MPTAKIISFTVSDKGKYSGEIDENSLINKKIFRAGVYKSPQLNTDIFKNTSLRDNTKIINKINEYRGNEINYKIK